MALDEELVAKGKKEPLEGLKAQGRNHLELLAQHPQVLEYGWTAAGTTALTADVALISTGEAARSDAQDSARAATLAQEKAIDAAKQFIASLRNVQPAVLRKAKRAGVVIEKQMLGSGTLARSVPAIASYLTTVQPTVKRLDAFFKPYVKVVASERIGELRSQLEAADAKQESAVGSTPELTAKIYEAKGRVLEAIEELNGIAKNAFAGNAAVIGKFNKDLLLRARRERAAKEAPKPE